MAEDGSGGGGAPWQRSGRMETEEGGRRTGTRDDAHNSAWGSPAREAGESG